MYIHQSQVVSVTMANMTHAGNDYIPIMWVVTKVTISALAPGRVTV